MLFFICEMSSTKIKEFQCCLTFADDILVKCYEILMTFQSPFNYDISMMC